MAEPWAASRVAYPLQPEDDLDESVKTDVSVIDSLIRRCIVRTTTAIERGALPGYDEFETAQLGQFIRSMMWTHEGIRQVLRQEGQPSSVDALALARVQLEGVYTICYMLHQPSSVGDYVKAGWKKTFSRFLLEQKEREQLPRFKEYETV